MIITTRSTSVHRPMFLTVDGNEYEVDGIDKQEGDFNLDDRWIISSLLEEYRTDISTYSGGHGEFYISTFKVPTDYDIFTEIKRGARVV